MSEEIERSGFVFYRSFYEALSLIDDEVTRLHIYEKIAAYCFGVESQELKGTAAAIFALMRPQLDANQRRFENGVKAKQKQTRSKPEAKQKQTRSKPEASFKQAESNTTPKVKEKVKVNVKEKVKEKEKEESPPTPLFEPFSFQNGVLSYNGDEFRSLEEEFCFLDLEKEVPKICTYFQKLHEATGDTLQNLTTRTMALLAKKNDEEKRKKEEDEREKKQKEVAKNKHIEGLKIGGENGAIRLKIIQRIGWDSYAAWLMDSKMKIEQKQLVVEVAGRHIAETIRSKYASDIEAASGVNSIAIYLEKKQAAMGAK